MGALFSGPKAPPPPPLPALEVPNPEDEERKARLDALRRRRRGIRGTVRTSQRGILKARQPAAGKKHLGE